MPGQGQARQHASWGQVPCSKAAPAAHATCKAALHMLQRAAQLLLPLLPACTRSAGAACRAPPSPAAAHLPTRASTHTSLTPRHARMAIQHCSGSSAKLRGSQGAAAAPGAPASAPTACAGRGGGQGLVSSARGDGLACSVLWDAVPPGSMLWSTLYGKQRQRPATRCSWRRGSAASTAALAHTAAGWPAGLPRQLEPGRPAWCAVKACGHSEQQGSSLRTCVQGSQHGVAGAVAAVRVVTIGGCAAAAGLATAQGQRGQRGGGGPSVEAVPGAAWRVACL